MNNFPENTEWGIVNVFDDVKYQEVLGFGGAFTESSAYLYSLLSKEDKKKFLELYFDREICHKDIAEGSADARGIREGFIRNNRSGAHRA